MNFAKDGHSWTPITKEAVQEQIQYWWSRYLNYPSNDGPKQAYLDLYNAYKKLLNNIDEI